MNNTQGGKRWWFGGVSALILAVSLGGCGGEKPPAVSTERDKHTQGAPPVSAAQAPPVEHAEATPPQAQPRDPAPAAAGGIAWKKSYAEAQKEAAAQQKPLLIDFATSWCGWCKVLDKMTWPDPDVVAASKRFVSVKLDGDVERELLAKYKVQGFPAIIFAKSDGEPIERVDGFVFPDPMALAMNAAAEGKSVEELVKNIEQQGPANFHERIVLADAAHKAGNFDQVIRLLEGQLNAAPPDKRASYEFGVQMLALSLAQQGRAAEGKALLEKALEDENVVGPDLLKRAMMFVSRAQEQ